MDNDNVSRLLAYLKIAYRQKGVIIHDVSFLNGINANEDLYDEYDLVCGVNIDTYVNRLKCYLR